LAHRADYDHWDWSAPVWLVLFLVGQGWSRVCAYAVAGFGIACLAFAAICMHLMYKALGARFGFKVSWRNAPPYRYKAFGTWCRGNGVDPATGRPLEADASATSPHAAVASTAALRTATQRGRSPARHGLAHSARSQVADDRHGELPRRR